MRSHPFLMLQIGAQPEASSGCLTAPLKPKSFGRQGR